MLFGSMQARSFSDGWLFEKWSDGYLPKINCSQYYVRWIGTCPNPRLVDNRVRGSQTCPVETRVHVRSHDFVRVHGRSLKKYRVWVRVRISNILNIIFHKPVSDPMSENMIEPMWLCPCPHLTLCPDIFDSGPKG